jgi:DNA-binding SARP family transcriptional activator
MVIEHDGEVVDHPDWRRDRVRGLFALIARHGTISRRAASDALRPDLDPEAAANNLRVTLSYLQRVLEPARSRHEVAFHVRSDGALLRFAGRSSWTVDVEEVERLLDTAERDDARGEAAVALDAYLAAIAWCRGPYLDDVTLDVSDEVERERLRSRHVRALLRAGSLLLAVGRVEEAQRLAVAAEAADPWSEQALCLQIECYLAVGDAPAALRTQRRAVEVVEELGLPCSDDLRRLARLVGA